MSFESLSVFSFYDFVIAWFAYIRGMFFAKTCQSKASLFGKTAVITGGNTGIGKATALELAKRGAKVILACRNIEKGIQAAHDIREKVPGANVLVKHLDLASLRSVRKFSQDVLKTEPYIHILINNAGVAVSPVSKTEDGFEMQFGVNHLGHFLLTILLLDRIKASAPSRIVNVSSALHTFGNIDFNDLNMEHQYKPFQAYCRSKLANVLFTRELAKKLEDTDVTTYCLHPGFVQTELGRNIRSSMSKFWDCAFHTSSRLFFVSAHKGAQTSVHCAVDESVASESGFYYSNCAKIQPSAAARDDIIAKKLWDVSENLVTSMKRNQMQL